MSRERAVAQRQKQDSLQNRESQEYLLSDYGVMAKIEDNTRQDVIKDGWNVYGIVALVVALLSLIASIYTFVAQRRTESNTKKLSKDLQRALLIDLIRHLYRNLVIIYTMRTKMEDIDYKGYPSEEHFDKLKIPMENIHLDAFYGEDAQYQIMHDLYLKLRNYNDEIEVAKNHLLNPNMSRDTKIEDFDTLEFKATFLTERILETISKIWGLNDALNSQIKSKIINKTNATNNIDIEGSDDFIPLTIEDLRKTGYGKIFSDRELIDICENFRRDVQEERMKNSRGAWKIRVIRF